MPETTRKISVNLPVTDQLLTDIVEVASYNSINYWAYYNETGDQWVEDEASDDNKPPKKFKLDTDLIALGLNRVFNPKFKVSSTILSSILSAICENDAGNIDADGADVIVQAAVFNEIVYG